MTSSIEPEFNPSDDLSRDEVIQMARRYIKYWSIEANHWNSAYFNMLEENHNLRQQNKELLLKIKPNE